MLYATKPYFVDGCFNLDLSASSHGFYISRSGAGRDRSPRQGTRNAPGALDTTDATHPCCRLSPLSDGPSSAEPKRMGEPRLGGSPRTRLRDDDVVGGHACQSLRRAPGTMITPTEADCSGIIQAQQRFQVSLDFCNEMRPFAPKNNGPDKLRQ